MKIYDFDKTIYNGDSGIDFFTYSLKKKPLLLICHMISYSFFIFHHIIKEKELKELKERLFSYVKKIKNLNFFIADFVNLHKHKVKKWYVEQQNEDDLIITAALDFYIVPLCKELGIKTIISTKYDIKTGKIRGNNCRDKEKVRRLNLEYPNIKVESVYSDSASDIPILKLGEKAFIIENNNILPYKKNYKFKTSKLKFFIDRNFLLFIFCGGIGTLINFLFSMFFSILLHPVIAYVFGYALSLFATYYLNIKLIFKRKINATDFIKFLISYLPNFIILFTFVYVFINIFSLSKVIVYLLAAVFGIPITYVIVKLFAFIDKKNGKNK